MNALLLLVPSPSPAPAPIHHHPTGAAPAARCGEQGTDGEFLVCGRADFDRRYRLASGVAPLPDATVKVGDTRLDLHAHRGLMPRQAVSDRVVATVIRPFRGSVAWGAGPPYLALEMLGGPMTSFDDRERSFEARFARDEEMAFRVTARRNRLVGTWAAGLMGLTPAETDAYAKAVVQADFEEAGDEDVVRKLLGDLTSAQVAVDDARIRAALHDATVEARRQLMGIE